MCRVPPLRLAAHPRPRHWPTCCLSLPLCLRPSATTRLARLYRPYHSLSARAQRPQHSHELSKQPLLHQLYLVVCFPSSLTPVAISSEPGSGPCAQSNKFICDNASRCHCPCTLYTAMCFEQCVINPKTRTHSTIVFVLLNHLITERILCTSHEPFPPLHHCELLIGATCRRCSEYSRQNRKWKAISVNPNRVCF